MKIFGKDNDFSIIKGVFAVIILQVIFVLLFAVLVYFIPLNNSIIRGVNQFTKVFALFIAVSLFVSKSRGLIKGGALGLLSGVLIYLLFSLISGNGIDVISLIVDGIFMTVIGAISGVIAVNVKKS